MSVSFEWNPGKAAVNARKHGVSFDEAGIVFDDQLAAVFHDDVHSDEEAREIVVGHSIGGRLLLVCFTERTSDVIRINSARSVTRKERKSYEENYGRPSDA